MFAKHADRNFSLLRQAPRSRNGVSLVKELYLATVIAPLHVH